MSQKVMIVDDQGVIHEILGLYIQSSCDYQIYSAFSVEEAKKILEKEENINFIFCDYNMPGGSGGNLYQYIKKYYPEIPFVLQSAEPLEFLPEFSEHELNLSYRYIQKPYQEKDIAEILNQLRVSSTPSCEYNEFIQIHAEFITKYQLKGTVYIKLPSGKLVKLRHSEDYFDLDVIERYNHKGVEYFYFHKDDILSVIEENQKKLKQIQFAPQVNFLEDVKQSAMTIDVIYDVAECLGIDESSIKLSHQLARKVTDVALSYSELEKVIRNVQKEGRYFSQISLLSTLIATTISKYCDTNVQSKLESIVEALILMDISWVEDHYEDSYLYRAVNIENDVLDDEDAKTIIRLLEHPNRSSTMLEKFITDRSVLHFIQRHHERPYGRGFPQHLGSSDISEECALLIFSHEYATRLLRLDSITPYRVADINIDITFDFNSGNYRPICKAFINAFC